MQGRGSRASLKLGEAVPVVGVKPDSGPTQRLHPGPHGAQIERDRAFGAVSAPVWRAQSD